MSAALAVVSVGLGVVYLALGLIILIDLKRGWPTMGFSRFGLAVVVLTVTCGPHHLEHGLHLGLAGRRPGLLELVTVVVGLPAGAVWAYLRVEAIRGGRGDRFISGTPNWMSRLTQVGVAYLATVMVVATAVAVGGGPLTPRLVPNVLLVGLYATIAIYLLRTQLANRPVLDGWSVSGLALALLFVTCAVMHLAWLSYALSGRYDVDGHGLIIDWLSVPAALYFLWVVRSLYLRSLRDWNHTATGLANEAHV
ncbi:MAG TPA: hypothetical protein VF711_00780 [Acidimicrobiales bacterium]|jgi:hypothetical protein